MGIVCVTVNWRVGADGFLCLGDGDVGDDLCLPGPGDPCVFDTLDAGLQQMMGGALGDDQPQQLADTVHAAWVAVATSGDPGWPRYELGRRVTMRLDTHPSALEDPYAGERTLWAGLR